MKTIGIYGCGWLGESLAISFLSRNFSVVGSTTTLSKIEDLKNKGIQAVCLKISEKLFCDNLDLLKKPDIYIINIPPSRKSPEQDSYLKIIKQLWDAIYVESKKYIFISSTSVYGDLQGVVTEESLCVPNTLAGQEILKVENYLKKNSAGNLTILRFGGLIDEKRHPANHLAGKKDLIQAEAFVNLIHKQDCIGILEKIVDLNVIGEVLNGVSDEHATRKHFYSSVCKKRDLDQPSFQQTQGCFSYKLVSNDKVKNKLSYSFKYPTLVDY